MASKETILLTGASGSLGSAMLLQLLSSDSHTVIVVLRSPSKANFIARQYPQHVANNTLQFITIPDMATPGAFDAAASQSDAIVHIATPLAYSSIKPLQAKETSSATYLEFFQKEMIRPTWDITLNILEAAKKGGRVKRVVLTSSIVTNFNIPGGDLFSGRTFGPRDYNPITEAEIGGNLGTAYQYSKTKVEIKAWKWMQDAKVEGGKNPGFDLVTLCVPSILGVCRQEGFVPDKDQLGGMSNVYQFFDRELEEGDGFMFPFVMDVDDVAKIHVQSLEHTVPSDRYIFHVKELPTAGMVARKIREEFPQLRERVREPTKVDDSWPSSLCAFDIENSEKAFGTDWKGWWESVKGTVEDILKFEKK